MPRVIMNPCGEPEERRKVHQFVARLVCMLDVEQFQQEMDAFGQLLVDLMRSQWDAIENRQDENTNDMDLKNVLNALVELLDVFSMRMNDSSVALARLSDDARFQLALQLIHFLDDNDCQKAGITLSARVLINRCLGTTIELIRDAEKRTPVLHILIMHFQDQLQHVTKSNTQPLLKWFMVAVRLFDCFEKDTAVLEEEWFAQALLRGFLEIGMIDQSCEKLALFLMKRIVDQLDIGGMYFCVKDGQSVEETRACWEEFFLFVETTQERAPHLSLVGT
jgi:hypothetical protein